jgi:4-hydroxy-tetrahydrodipicolinate reductase
MIRLTITGACGRMGNAIFRLATLDPDFAVVHILEAQGHPLVGQEIPLAGVSEHSLVLEDDAGAAIGDCDVVVDFTQAEASLNHFHLAFEQGRAIVVGTTGLSPEALSGMKQAAGARAVISPNMSIGVNLLFSLVHRAAQVIGKDYDTEIVEIHHKWKKDAPSGTALRLKEMVTAAGPDRQWTEVTGRKGIIGERTPNEIGVMSLRAGDIVGEHTVLFAGIGERLEITHRAYSRDNFSRGSLAAAKWLVNQPEGIYDMADVLGLNQYK